MESPMLKYIKHIMIITGAMPLFLITTHKRLYRFYQYMVQASLFSFMIFKYGALLTFQGSVEMMFETANMIVIFTTVYIKGLVCITSNMGKLVHELITYEAKIMNSSNPKILKTYKQTLIKSKLIELCYIGLIYLVFFAFIVPHYVNYFRILFFDEKFNSTLNSERPKPYNWWLPFDGDRYYLITLLLQSYCALMTSNYFCFIQVILIILPINITLRLKVLRINLKSVNQINLASEGDSIVRKMISVHAEEHIDIIRNCVFLNDTVKYIMLMEFLVTSAELSLGLFMFVSMTDSSIRIFAATYVLQTLGQLLISYWYANQIREESVAVAHSVYEMNWYKFDRSMKTSLQIMIMRSQKPLSLTVGPFGNVTLEMAVKIIKASYTYVAFMQQTYEGSDSVF